jgi:hypothetical protein
LSYFYSGYQGEAEVWISDERLWEGVICDEAGETAYQSVLQSRQERNIGRQRRQPKRRRSRGGRKVNVKWKRLRMKIKLGGKGITSGIRTE